MPGKKYEKERNNKDTRKEMYKYVTDLKEDILSRIIFIFLFQATLIYTVANYLRSFKNIQTTDL